MAETPQRQFSHLSPAQGFGIRISAQGLAKRFHKRAVVYAQSLFEESLRQFCHPHGLPSELLQWFSGNLPSRQYAIHATVYPVADMDGSRYEGNGGWDEAPTDL